MTSKKKKNVKGNSSAGKWASKHKIQHNFNCY
uniref:Uncharacterized protein n=1 Tax=Rhizophora mucronata TaxID=61149 RepID=A0A2P2NK12_RHIMU